MKFIYRFHANAERRQDWQDRIIRKTLSLPKQEDIILNSMTQTKKKKSGTH